MTASRRETPSDSAQTALHRILLDFQAEPQLLLDASGRVVQSNAAVAQLVSSSSLPGRHWSELIRFDEAAQVHDPFPSLQTVLDGARQSLPPTPAIWLADSTPLKISLRAQALPDGGVVVGLGTLVSATADGMIGVHLGTGLPGRTGFESRLREVLERIRCSSQSAVLCYIQIEQLKSLNAVLGYEAGQRLLQQLVQMLQRQLTAEDVLAQLDTDEFGLLIMEELDAVRPWIDQLIDSSQRLLFLHDGRSYAVALSVGVIPVDSSADNAQALLRQAAAACFEAMEPGHDRVVYAVAGDDISERRRQQLAMLGDIGRALDDSQFTLFFEDVVQAQNLSSVVYRELLMRVQAPDGTLLAPAAFIQAAERYTLMNSIDRWVVREAFQQISRLPDDGVVYALNVSGQSLSDSRFLDYLKAELLNCGLAPQRLCFEITETGMVARLVEAKAFVQHMSSLGCRFALDDFGSGMATFAYLRDFPVDYLKIDGVFVHNMLSSFVDRSIVESINRISHELGLLTIAEHVDQRILADTLRDSGIDLLQGHAIQRAQPLSELLK